MTVNSLLSLLLATADLQQYLVWIKQGLYKAIRMKKYTLLPTDMPHKICHNYDNIHYKDVCKLMFRCLDV